MNIIINIKICNDINYMDFYDEMDYYPPEYRVDDSLKVLTWYLLLLFFFKYIFNI